MKNRMACASLVVALIVVGGWKTTPVAAQQQSGIPPASEPGINPPGPTQPGSHPLNTDFPDNSQVQGSMREKMLRQANEQRHKKMLDDANKMVQLANELKADVVKMQNDELSVATLKKAAEVEKLARDVQQRMKQQ